MSSRDLPPSSRFFLFLNIIHHSEPQVNFPRSATTILEMGGDAEGGRNILLESVGSSLKARCDYLVQDSHPDSELYSCVMIINEGTW